jgi:hypothetical protein
MGKLTLDQLHKSRLIKVKPYGCQLTVEERKASRTDTMTRYVAKYRKTEAGIAATRRASRNAARKKRLGKPVTEEFCIILLAKQNNQCGICHKHLLWPDKDTCLDHDHKTGKVRGILCSRCNRGLGHFQDNVESLRQAVTYLTMDRK